MRIRLAIIVLIIVELGLSGSAHSQYTSTGIDIGANRVAFRKSINTKSVFDPLKYYSLGLRLGFHKNDKTALITGIYFDRKGGKEEGYYVDDAGNILGRVDAYNVLEYLTVPVLIQYTASGSINTHAGIGLYGSMLINQTLDIDPFKDYPSQSESNTSDYNFHDYGLIASIGFSKNVNEKWNIRLDGRYNIGLVEIDKNSTKNLATKQNSIWNIFIGFSYFFQKEKIKN